MGISVTHETEEPKPEVANPQSNVARSIEAAREAPTRWRKGRAVLIPQCQYVPLGHSLPFERYPRLFCDKCENIVRHVYAGKAKRAKLALYVFRCEACEAERVFGNSEVA